MIKDLNSGYFIGLASDQNAKDSGENVNIFDKTVSFPLGAEKLKQKTRKKIFFVICTLDKNFHYKVKVEEILSDNISTNQLFANKLQHYITKYPSQYFWFHRIFNKEIYKI